MALLLGVYAVKLFHTHPHFHTHYSGHEPERCGEMNVHDERAAACDICHFEFTRDATLPDTIQVYTPLIHFIAVNSIYNSVVYSVPYFSSFQRGPPLA